MKEAAQICQFVESILSYACPNWENEPLTPDLCRDKILAIATTRKRHVSENEFLYKTRRHVLFGWTKERNGMWRMKIALPDFLDSSQPYVESVSNFGLYRWSEVLKPFDNERLLRHPSPRARRAAA